MDDFGNFQFTLAFRLLMCFFFLCPIFFCSTKGLFWKQKRENPKFCLWVIHSSLIWFTQTCGKPCLPLYTQYSDTLFSIINHWILNHCVLAKLWHWRRPNATCTLASFKWRARQHKTQGKPFLWIILFLCVNHHVKRSKEWHGLPVLLFDFVWCLRDTTKRESSIEELRRVTSIFLRRSCILIVERSVAPRGSNESSLELCKSFAINSQIARLKLKGKKKTRIENTIEAFRI